MYVKTVQWYLKNLLTWVFKGDGIHLQGDVKLLLKGLKRLVFQEILVSRYGKIKKCNYRQQLNVWKSNLFLLATLVRRNISSHICQFSFDSFIPIVSQNITLASSLHIVGWIWRLIRELSPNSMYASTKYSFPCDWIETTEVTFFFNHFNLTDHIYSLCIRVRFFIIILNIIEKKEIIS